ncbi:DUF1772 domain-containing protein [Micromonospora sp. CPCC 205371]|nr:DUF1772 domain-containing protein [Micromonospora sp. CPCC 205371]
MIRVLLPLALMGSGLAAGGLMISALGGAPLLLTLSTKDYIPIHQFLVTRFDPFMPIALLTGLAADVVLAATAPNAAARGLAAAGATLLVAAVAVSITKNVPINKWVSRLDPRMRWRNWNLVRTALAVIALLCNAALVSTVV